jgi:cytochrome c-type biogenesis protein CcmH/NrfG
MNPERMQAAERRDQARRDLEELNLQVEAGELDPATADSLAATYRDELAEAEATLAGLEEDLGGEPGGRSMRRILVGALLLVVAFAGVAFTVGRFVVERDDGPLQGAAGQQADFDPSEVSNETLEAVVAANADDPMINGMRLALAGRYFDERDYQRAFVHYQAVLDAEPSAAEAGEALARLGWMVYEGNGEVELATSLLDRSLDVRPDDPLTVYLLARVTWCGAGDARAAVSLLERVLVMPGVEGEVAASVERDLAAAREGRSCP